MDKEKVKQQIMDLEVQFCKDVEELGMEGWDKYLSKSAIIATSGHDGLIIGKDIIMDRFKELYGLGYFTYQWEPMFVEVSDDLSMAYCITLYYMEYKVDEDVFKFKGKDCNIWKLEDGEYKLVLEIGNKVED